MDSRKELEFVKEIIQYILNEHDMEIEYDEDFKSLIISNNCGEFEFFDR